MSKHIAHSPFFAWVFEIITPVVSWLIITFPLWLSPFHPALVAYFIIAFDLYFFYKAIHTSYHATAAYRKISAASKINFVQKLSKIKDSSRINHLIVIPNYREPIYKLESSIRSIIQNKYKKDKLFLILAFEKREEEAQEKAAILINKFRNYFNQIIATYHILQPNEIHGKASNQTYATKIAKEILNKKGIEDESILVTICDADSHFSNNYFSYLTCEYLVDKDRQYHFYWAPVLLYNNFWQLPLFVRVQATLSSVVRLAFLEYKENLIQISTYTTNMWLLKQINFWDVDIISEDWHVYLQAFFKFGNKLRTLPLYTVVNGDAVYSGGLFKTFMNRYEQEKRWAWGASDIGYAIKKSFDSPNIDFLTKLKKIIFLAQHHVLWPSSFFLLTLSASIPPLINPVFKRTVMGFILPKLSGIILTLTSSLLILYIYLDIKLRNKMKIKTNLTAIPMLFVQWYFLPLISFFFSSLPALDAQSRLLLGKKMTYKVTEKV